MKTCAICGKGSIIRGTRRLLRGHYNPTKSSRKYPNLQWLTVPGKPRIQACAKCIKAHGKGLVKVA